MKHWLFTVWWWKSILIKNGCSNLKMCIKRNHVKNELHIIFIVCLFFVSQNTSAFGKQSLFDSGLTRVARSKMHNHCQFLVMHNNCGSSKIVRLHASKMTNSNIRRNRHWLYKVKWVIHFTLNLCYKKWKNCDQNFQESTIFNHAC